MTSFAAILRDFEHHPDIKMIVLLGELGNRDELEVAEMIAQ
jgi:succinyl-CoA synthetase alpha subunit